MDLQQTVLQVEFLSGNQKGKGKLCIDFVSIQPSRYLHPHLIFLTVE